MSCCGKNRPLSGVPTGVNASTAGAAGMLQRDSIFFEYTGRTSLIVIGPVSGRYYRFHRPGARLPVDRRDCPGLERVATLRKIEPR